MQHSSALDVPTRACSLAGGLVLIAAAWTLLPGCVAQSDGVQLTRQSDRVRVEIDGELFTEYRFAGQPQPVLFPVLGPGGQAMTRNFPLVVGAEAGVPTHLVVVVGVGEALSVELLQVPSVCQCRQALLLPLQTLALLIIWMLPA